jgi:hypothetical protein
MSIKNSNDYIGNRSRDLTVVCSAVPQPLLHRVPPIIDMGRIKVSYRQRKLYNETFLILDKFNLALYLNFSWLCWWKFKQSGIGQGIRNISASYCKKHFCLLRSVSKKSNLRLNDGYYVLYHSRDGTVEDWSGGPERNVRYDVGGALGGVRM